MPSRARTCRGHLLDLWAASHDVKGAVVLADRVLVKRPHPGRLFEVITINLSRPRDRNAPLFDQFKRHVLTALDRTMPDTRGRREPGGGPWW
ncbi:hypothetical protein ACRAVF_11635 [Bradyrhizobium oligotrophicum S58]